MPLSRVQQSLQREAGGRRRSLSAVAVSQEQIRADLATLRQQLAWMNASLVSLCRPCPWHWELFQGSCYLFSRSQRTWESSVSACEDMSAQLVVVNTADEQKFLQSWEIRNEKRTWIGLSDRHTEGSWQWVDGTPVGLSFWKQGEPNNHGDEDCVELYNDGWNDSLCHLEKAWICEMPSSPCPVP
ncbi:CD209 antigen-like [Talpa occidentalis]|uniref:CD209 antigen-like n=1 Tax=Talpa occidentalis TaxID=50954 RepID=UPI0018903D82|nr:CD209 antigen-like [Talpa occidentalis]